MAAAATIRNFGTQGLQAAGLNWIAAHGNCHVKDLDLDAIMVERCLSGDEAAWEQLVRTHTRRVYAICYRFTGSGSEAQDLTQDVFLRIFRTLKSFRAGEGSFVVWLSRLTRNLLVDHYRRTKADRVTDSIEDQLPMLEEAYGNGCSHRWNAGRPRSERNAAVRFAETVAGAARKPWCFVILRS